MKSARRDLDRGACRTVGAALALLVLLAPRALRAQAAPPPSSPPPTTTPPTSADGATPAPDPARLAFERGVAALAEFRYADAVVAFEQSYRARRLAIVTYNLALAYRALGRYRDAIAAFEQYLARPDPRERPARLAALREEVAQLRRSLVSLTLVTTPPYAAVRIDGRARADDVREITLDPGTHAIEVDAEGFRPHRQEVTLPPAAQIVLDVRLDLLEGTGRILVDPSVPDALVYIDGRLAGAGRAEQPARAGLHRVEIRAAGYRPFRRTVTVGRSGLVRVDATLARPGPPAWVVPTSVVVGAAVIAGAVVGGYYLLASDPGFTGSWANVREMR